MTTTNDWKPAAANLLRDNPVLIAKVVAATGCDAKDVLPGLTEVLKFLDLVARSEGMLTPSHRVDLIWHEFILCTRAYHQFCAEHFAHYIHHSPGGESDQNERQFLRTLALYEARFGSPPAAYWHSKHDAAIGCGACEAAS